MLYPEEGESFVTYDLDWSESDTALRSSPWYRETKRQNMETENYPLNNRNRIIDEKNNTIYKPDPVKPENDTLDAEDIPENQQANMAVKRMGELVRSVTPVRLSTVYLENLDCHLGMLFRHLCVVRTLPVMDIKKVKFSLKDEEQTFLRVNGDQFSSDQDFKY